MLISLWSRLRSEYLRIRFFISAFVAELELQPHRDTTKGPEQPTGQRGAIVADQLAGVESG